MDNKDDQVIILARKIDESDNNIEIEEKLKTSERVLKRITDGIYREPSSALRELIANAYDADATKVIIQTDPPRFNEIRIHDDGNGFSPKALANLIFNIGGSAKRTLKGNEYGVSNEKDLNLSPGGRKLIGKIGIGLFAVSQLTKEFQIITKTEGTDFRTIADVNLTTHSEDNPETEFEPGSVTIWKVPATDTSTHGTDIVLRNIMPKIKNDLSSKSLWEECKTGYYEEMGGEKNNPRKPPKIHIGSTQFDDSSILMEKPEIPWKIDDTPKQKFNKLVDSVYNFAFEDKRYCPAPVEIGILGS